MRTRAPFAFGPMRPNCSNKLGCAQRRAGDMAAAEASLRRALSLAPAFALARVNLGTLQVEQRRQTEARANLRQALADPGLEAEARREASVALALMDEHDRLAPAIAEAVEQEVDAPILRMISSVATGSLPGDERLLETFGNLAAQASTADLPPIHARGVGPDRMARRRGALRAASWRRAGSDTSQHPIPG